MPITWLDIILLVFMLISALLAMARGFTREVLSLASWGLAAVVALVAFPRLQPTARQYLDPAWLADIALIVTTFVVALIVISFITFRLTERLLDSKVGALDRSMGFVFGAARGLVLVAIAFLFFSWLVPDEHSPPWIREAKSKVVLESTGEAILSVLPDDPDALLSRFKSMQDRNRAESPPPDGTAAPGGAEEQGLGYRPSERQGLDQLLESTRSPGADR